LGALVYADPVMRASRGDRPGGQPTVDPDPQPAPDPTVVFVPPASPEANADAWRRFVKALDWLCRIGAQDA